MTIARISTDDGPMAPVEYRPHHQYHKGLRDRAQIDTHLALVEMGFSDAKGALSPRATAALAAFAEATIFRHSGVTLRRPNHETIEALRYAITVGADPATALPVAYGTGDERGRCRMVPKYGPGYWPAMRAALRASERGHRKAARRAQRRGLRPPVDRGIPALIRSRIARAHHGELEWKDLYRHLLGDDAGPQHLQWAYLQSCGDTAVPYLVLDLDDKGDQIPWPTAPRQRIADQLAFLTETVALDPARAVVVSSPGGRGRHLYYPLSAPAPAVDLARAADLFLRWKLLELRGTALEPGDKHVGTPGIDVFPTGHRNCTHNALPLGRGSARCDAAGYPLPRGSRIEELEAFAAAFAAARARPLDLAELAVPAGALPRLLPAKDAAPPQTDPQPEVDADDGGEDPIDVDHAADADPAAPVAAPTKFRSAQVLELLANGLTAQGQRYRACLTLLRSARGHGHSKQQATDWVKAWLRDHHNGKSDDYNADPGAALAAVDGYAASVFKSHDPADLALDQRQVEFITQLLLRAARSRRIKAKPGTSSFHHLLIFACFLAAQVEAFAASASFGDQGRSSTEGGLEAQVAATVMARFPFGTDRPRARHLGDLGRAGLLTVVEDYTFDNARVYRLNPSFPARSGSALPVRAALVSYLGEERRWAEVMDRQAWARMRREVANCEVSISPAARGPLDRLSDTPAQRPQLNEVQEDAAKMTADEAPGMVA